MRTDKTLQEHIGHEIPPDRNIQQLMETAAWIWCEDDEPNVYCQARGRLHLSAAVVDAIICVVADSRYQLWVNGEYTGQGPTPFKRPNVFVDSYDASGHLRPGANVIAVLGAYHGVKHCTYTPGMPGILAHLRVIDADGKENLLVTDASWKALASRAYARIVPRRTWATAWCEYYDARLAEPGWERPDYDDSSWPAARLNTPAPVRFSSRMVAPLREFPADGVGIAGIWRAGKGIPEVPVGAVGRDAERQGPLLTAYLDEESLEPLPNTATTELSCFTEDDRRFPLKLKAADKGLAVTIDLGREIAGQVELDIEGPAGIVVDLCPAELLREGRPWCFRKEGDYAKRYITRDGRQQWRGFGFDGFRYLHAVVRGPHAALTLHRLGAWRRESGLPIKATFECDDRVVDRIWNVTCHTVRICSQDIHIDCPTREQTSAWGDNVWTGVWAAYLTGDASALRHLMLSAEHVQLSDGQMPCYAFSETHDLRMFDYSLICVLGIWHYLLVSGDRALAERLIPVADRILDWYRKKIGTTGLIELDCDEAFRAGKGLVFIDHPGLGWHNCPHPGLDRRGINAALNFFFLQSLEAEANVLAHIGQGTRESLLRKEAGRMRVTAERLFWNPDQKAYVDGYYQEKQSAQVSQQTNALAVMSGVCPSARAPRVLARVLDPDDAALCRCGTYAWLYLAEALCRCGMHETMWREVVRLWDGMARQGATTWWETFVGDELDSLCHFWSCAPGYLIQSEILGIKPAEPGFARIAVSPRFDLLEKAKGSVPLPDGEARVEWQMHSEKECHLRVDLSTAGDGLLRLPQGWVTGDERANEVRLPPNSSIRVRARRRTAGPISGSRP